MFREHPSLVFIFGTIYGLILSAFSMLNIGAGHGTHIPMALTFAPLQLIHNLVAVSNPIGIWITWIYSGFIFICAPIFWGFLLYMASQGHQVKIRLKFFLAMVLRYTTSIILALKLYHEESLVFVQEIEPAFLFGWGVLFVIGEISVWYLFFRTSLTSRSPGPIINM